MTAYLQPGDKIHLAIPVDSNQTRDGILRQAKDSAESYIKDYARMGVEIVIWTANSTLNHPLVVSVIRSPKAGLAQLGPRSHDHVQTTVLP
jgi:hypothetical protein